VLHEISLVREGMRLLGFLEVALAVCAAGMGVLVHPQAAMFSSEVIREIDDPHTGDRWLLEPNLTHPEGPGRLVRLVGTGPGAGDRAGVVSSRNGAALVAVIRAGDRLIVEENTAVVEARLEAVALGAAAPGSTFNVRLRIGGRVLRAVALGPGRAALAPVNGIEP
jgi:hypothetical protein